MNSQDAATANTATNTVSIDTVAEEETGPKTASLSLPNQNQMDAANSKVELSDVDYEQNKELKRAKNREYKNKVKRNKKKILYLGPLSKRGK